MLLNLTDMSDEPLHGQISRQVRAQILSRQLEAGAPLPSIRALARKQRVSVITVQRAYEDLEREGLLVSRRGKGFFAACLPRRTLQQQAQARASEALRRVVGEAQADGLDARQIRALLDEILDEGDKA